MKPNVKVVADFDRVRLDHRAAVAQIDRDRVAAFEHAQGRDRVESLRARAQVNALALDRGVDRGDKTLARGFEPRALRKDEGEICWFACDVRHANACQIPKGGV